MFIRDSFRRAFDGFDIPTVAAYDEAKAAALMQDAGIVRNRCLLYTSPSPTRPY